MSLADYETYTADGRTYRRIRRDKQHQHEPVEEAHGVFGDELPASTPLGVDGVVDAIFAQAIVTPTTTRTVTLLPVPQNLHRLFEGKFRHALTQVKEHGCIIDFGGNDDNPDVVRVVTTKQETVPQILELFRPVVSSVLRTLRPTHTLAIRFQSQDLQTQVRQFRDLLVRENHLNPKYFNNPENLHLTLLVMKVVTAQQVDVASQLLEDVALQVYDVLHTQTLLFEFCGVAAMSDPTHAKVLYLKVRPTRNVLQPLVDLLRKTYQPYVDSKELCREPIFHVTLFNCSKKHASGENVEVDFTEILRRHAGKSFGRFRADSLEFAQMNNTELKQEYRLLNSIALP